MNKFRENSREWCIRWIIDVSGNANTFLCVWRPIFARKSLNLFEHNNGKLKEK